MVKLFGRGFPGRGRRRGGGRKQKKRLFRIGRPRLRFAIARSVWFQDCYMQRPIGEEVAPRGAGGARSCGRNAAHRPGFFSGGGQYGLVVGKNDPFDRLRKRPRKFSERRIKRYFASPPGGNRWAWGAGKHPFLRFQSSTGGGRGPGGFHPKAIAAGRAPVSPSGEGWLRPPQQATHRTTRGKTVARKRLIPDPGSTPPPPRYFPKFGGVPGTKVGAARPSASAIPRPGTVGLGWKGSAEDSSAARPPPRRHFTLQVVSCLWPGRDLGGNGSLVGTRLRTGASPHRSSTTQTRKSFADVFDPTAIYHGPA